MYLHLHYSQALSVKHPHMETLTSKRGNYINIISVIMFWSIMNLYRIKSFISNDKS